MIPKVGISACLLGEPVRYDGAHKRDGFIAETLGQLVEWVPVCPEVECGLPVPREAMRLVGEPESPRLVTRSTGIDQTRRLVDWIDKRLEELAPGNLSGFVFKCRSPSCGMRNVPVYDQGGEVQALRAGLFARALMDRLPGLPVIDEEGIRLGDLLAEFVEGIMKEE